ncbi:MAG: hypothetical protein GY756_01495 [bacterium]|nr:hypothetical protein [bacterium]
MKNLYECCCGRNFKTSSELLEHIRDKESRQHYAIQHSHDNISCLFPFYEKIYNKPKKTDAHLNKGHNSQNKFRDTAYMGTD